jgi:hypothetical protein
MEELCDRLHLLGVVRLCMPCLQCPHRLLEILKIKRVRSKQSAIGRKSVIKGRDAGLAPIPIDLIDFSDQPCPISFGFLSTLFEVTRSRLPVGHRMPEGEQR